MPSPGKAWYHITLGTYASWLPGDPRGFRDRKHRVHSGGDHRGLHTYHKLQSDPPTVVSAGFREVIGQKLVEHLIKLNHRVLAVSVAGMHTHLLVELPIDREAAKHEITRCKQAAALAVRGQIQGRLWAKGLGIKRIKDRVHQVNVMRYVVKHRGEGAWVWVFNQ